MSDNNNAVDSFPVFAILGSVLVVLKLLGHITCSWWIVTAPFWAPLAIFLSIILVMLAIAGVATLVNRR